MSIDFGGEVQVPVYTVTMNNPANDSPWCTDTSQQPIRTFNCSVVDHNKQIDISSETANNVGLMPPDRQITRSTEETVFPHERLQILTSPTLSWTFCVHRQHHDMLETKAVNIRRSRWFRYTSIHVFKLLRDISYIMYTFSHYSHS